MSKMNKNYMIAGNSLKSNTKFAKQRLLALAMLAAKRQETEQEKFTPEEFQKLKRKNKLARKNRALNRHQSKSQW